MLKLAYTYGVNAALTKLGLLDGESKRNYYAAIEHKSPMMGENATGNYDELLALLRSATAGQAFDTVDRHLPASDDNRTDLTPSPPVAGSTLEHL